MVGVWGSLPRAEAKRLIGSVTLCYLVLCYPFLPLSLSRLHLFLFPLHLLSPPLLQLASAVDAPTTYLPPLPLGVSLPPLRSPLYAWFKCTVPPCAIAYQFITPYPWAPLISCSLRTEGSSNSHLTGAGGSFSWAVPPPGGRTPPEYTPWGGSRPTYPTKIADSPGMPLCRNVPMYSHPPPPPGSVRGGPTSSVTFGVWLQQM